MDMNLARVWFREPHVQLREEWFHRVGGNFRSQENSPRLLVHVTVDLLLQQHLQRIIENLRVRAVDRDFAPQQDRRLNCECSRCKLGLQKLSQSTDRDAASADFQRRNPLLPAGDIFPLFRENVEQVAHWSRRLGSRQ